MDVRRLVNLVHYWLMRNANEQERSRIEGVLEAPLGVNDVAEGDWEQTMAGMRM